MLSVFIPRSFNITTHSTSETVRQKMTHRPISERSRKMPLGRHSSLKIGETALYLLEVRSQHRFGALHISARHSLATPATNSGRDKCQWKYRWPSIVELVQRRRYKIFHCLIARAQYFALHVSFLSYLDLSPSGVPVEDTAFSSIPSAAIVLSLFTGSLVSDYSPVKDPYKSIVFTSHLELIFAGPPWSFFTEKEAGNQN